MRRSVPLRRRGKRRFSKHQDDPYLRWIATQPCLIAGRSWFGRLGGEHPHHCLGDIVAHHVTSKAAGGTDRETLPMCVGAHEEVHRTGQATFARRYGLDWIAELAHCLARWEAR